MNHAPTPPAERLSGWLSLVAVAAVLLACVLLAGVLWLFLRPNDVTPPPAPDAWQRRQQATQHQVDSLRVLEKEVSWQVTGQQRRLDSLKTLNARTYVVRRQTIRRAPARQWSDDSVARFLTNYVATPNQ